MENNNTADSVSRFGYEWAKYSGILPEYEGQFINWTSVVPVEEWRGKLVLDVGCGNGRNSYWILKRGAKHVTAIDADERTIASAVANLESFENVDVQRVNVYDMDFDNRFDIAVSIGVLHHLNLPDVAMNKMVSSVKKGGKVVIWVYGLENNTFIVKYLDPIRKKIFSKIPVSITHHLSLYPAIVVFLLLRTGGLPKIKYFQFLRSAKFSNLRSIVFDQMLPHIANYWSKEEVIAILEKAGLKDIEIRNVNDMSWSASGIK